MANTPSNLPPPPAPGGFAPPGGTPLNNAPAPAPSGPALSYGAPVTGSGTATPPSPTVPRMNQQSTPAPSGVQPVASAPARPIPPAGGVLTQPATAYGAQSRNIPAAVPSTGQQQTPAPSFQASGEPEVHTMPEKFLPQAQAKKSMTPLKKMLLIGGTIIAVMLIITAVVVLIFTRQQQQVNQNVAVVNGTNVNRTNTNVVNANTNQNVNAGNVNGNANVNGGVNTNTNTNVNTNTNGPLNTNTGETREITSTKDTDKDNLTDNEEIIWGSSQAKPDTDGDGFLDGEEVSNGYSPTSATTLAQDPTAATFSNQTYGYTVLYPARWVAGQLDESDVDILFTAETGEFVEVTVGSNPKLQTAKQWYLEQFPEIEGKALETFDIDGVIGVKSIDGLTGYIASGETIFVVTYNIGTRSQANFLTTFDMMLNTFNLGTNGSTTGNQNNNQNTNQ